MLRILISILLLSACVTQSDASVFLDRLLASKAIDRDKSAILVTDLATGETLDALNTGVSLIPASIMKTATIAALLPQTGCDYRYLTRVYADGPVRDGEIDGNLLIVGSGDPSLNAGCDPPGPDFIAEITDALNERGIQHIKGRIVVDSSIFTSPATPPSWVAADTRQKYGTGCHGFNFRHNASGSSSVADPSSLFSKALAARLKTSGIEIEDRDCRRTPHPLLLVDHKSAAIDEIMRSCMMRSDNLFAEALLRTLPVVRGREGDTDLASRMAADYWKKLGLNLDGVRIVDGSGLSRENRVTARFLGDIMSRMAVDPDYASFLPLAGQEGTLKNFLKDTDLDSYIALKTGSMNGIQCYAGYKLDDDYVPTHSIVVILNALPKGRAAARSALETYFLGLFSSQEPQ